MPPEVMVLCSYKYARTTVLVQLPTARLCAVQSVDGRSAGKGRKYTREGYRHRVAPIRPCSESDTLTNKLGHGTRYMEGLLHPYVLTLFSEPRPCSSFMTEERVLRDGVSLFALLATDAAVQVVVPPELANVGFSEKVVYLPHSYQANNYNVSHGFCPGGEGLSECHVSVRQVNGLLTFNSFHRGQIRTSSEQYRWLVFSVVVYTIEASTRVDCGDNNISVTDLLTVVNYQRQN